jgi:hypothetical protein
MKGVVIEAGVLGLQECYVVYKCATEVDGKARDMYYLLKDTDEYERMEVDSASLRFTDGNTILHRMTASPHAVRFFSGVAPYRESKISLYNWNTEKYELSPLLAENGKSQDWLQLILDSKNLRAMEAVFSFEGSTMMEHYYYAKALKIKKT